MYIKCHNRMMLGVEFCSDCIVSAEATCKDASFRVVAGPSEVSKAAAAGSERQQQLGSRFRLLTLLRHSRMQIYRFSHLPVCPQNGTPAVSSLSPRPALASPSPTPPLLSCTPHPHPSALLLSRPALMCAHMPYVRGSGEHHAAPSLAVSAVTG